MLVYSASPEKYSNNRQNLGGRLGSASSRPPGTLSGRPVSRRAGRMASGRKRRTCPLSSGPNIGPVRIRPAAMRPALPQTAFGLALKNEAGFGVPQVLLQTGSAFQVQPGFGLQKAPASARRREKDRLPFTKVHELSHPPQARSWRFPTFVDESS